MKKSKIRVRLPDEDRLLSTLDTLKVRTPDGLVPLSNFITRTPVPKLAQINRINQNRYFDVKADSIAGLQKVVRGENEATEILAYFRPDEDGAYTSEGGATYSVFETTSEGVGLNITAGLDNGTFRLVPVTANERIEQLNAWLATSPFPQGIDHEWTGDQEDQEESGAFLSQAFAGALFLMFIILLAQFNSFYNAALVLLAVVLSTTGVLIGMIVMQQPFSIIMTGTGIVALAGIVVE